MLPIFTLLTSLSYFLRGCNFNVWSGLSEVGTISLFMSLMLIIISAFGIEQLPLSSVFIISSILVLLINTVFVIYIFNVTIHSYNSKFSLTNIFNGFSYMLNTLISYLQQWGIIFFESVFSPQQIVSIVISMKIASSISFVLQSLDMYFASKYSQFFQRSKIQALRKYKDLSDIICYFSAAFLFCATLIFCIVYGLLAHTSYDFYFISFIFIVAYSLNLFLGNNGYLLIMSGSINLVTSINVVSTSISLILVYLFIVFTRNIYISVAVIAFSIIFRQYIFYILAEKRITSLGKTPDSFMLQLHHNR